MNVQEALYLRITADAGVSAIATGGLWDGVLSQSANYPAIAYRMMDRVFGGYVLNNPEDPPGDWLELWNYRFRFYSAASIAVGGQSAARATDKALLESINKFVGTIANTNLSPPESLGIQGIFHESSFDFYDDPTQTYQVISDFDVWAEEPRPA